MKTMMRGLLVLLMMVVAVPVFSGEATQMWRCELDDDATEAEVLAYAGEWLKAAKKLNGGANIESQVFFPVAVNATGEMDLMYVLTLPTFEEWGKFWDAYPGSEAAKLEANEMVVCPDSVLWESVKIK